MKNTAITVLIILLVIVFGLSLASFQVRETESALVTTFGKATAEDEIKAPGWHFRWPPPIQRIHKFDSRMRVLVAEPGETTTRGNEPIIVNTYVVWRIAEPLQFFNAVGTVKEAENKLLSQINHTQNQTIGKHSFDEFVNSDPGKIRFEEIQDEMLAELQGAVKDLYGIEVKTLGIKQLKISEDVSKNIFESIKAERNRKTESIKSEGNAQARKIKDEASSIKTELLAAAEARAKAIRGQGDAEAAKYYKMLDADRALAMYLRDIEALKKVLEKRSTIIINTDTAPFRLLKEMPALKPEE